MQRDPVRLVVVESPFAADSEDGIDANVEYARACVRDCVTRGEAPIASHLLYTQPGILKDEVPEERALGMKAGHAWIRVADASVVYIDRGITRGMRTGVSIARGLGKTIEVRSIKGEMTDVMRAEFERTLGIAA